MADEGVRSAGKPIPVGRRQLADRGREIECETVAIHAQEMARWRRRRKGPRQFSAPLSRIMIRLWRGLVYLEHAVDFDDAAKRQRVRADGEAGMAPGIAKHLDH